MLPCWYGGLHAVQDLGEFCYFLLHLFHSFGLFLDEFAFWWVGDDVEVLLRNFMILFRILEIELNELPAGRHYPKNGGPKC